MVRRWSKLGLYADCNAEVYVGNIVSVVLEAQNRLRKL